MYSVKTVITPIDYGWRLPDAMLHYNTEAKKKAYRLDVRILQVLRYADIRGIRAYAVREAAKEQQTIFSATFNTSMNRLLDHHLITRRKHKNAVYYNITQQGIEMLNHIDSILTRIVQEEFDARNKDT